MDAQELELRSRQLDQESRFKREELDLKKTESSRWITGPVAATIAAAAIAGCVAYYGHSLTKNRNELAEREFCYKVMQDLVAKDSAALERQRKALLQFASLLTDSAHPSNSACEGKLFESVDLLTSAPQQLTAATTSLREPIPAAIAVERTAAPPGNQTAGRTPAAAECKKIEAITALGWRSGHKTKFCTARGFDGVYNPYGDYGAGGFCYQGDKSACVDQIASAVNN